jgi:hypothetical protein
MEGPGWNEHDWPICKWAGRRLQLVDFTEEDDWATEDPSENVTLYLVGEAMLQMPIEFAPESTQDRDVEHYEQFVSFLFPPDDSTQVGGYSELLELQKRIEGRIQEVSSQVIEMAKKLACSSVKRGSERLKIERSGLKRLITRHSKISQRLTCLNIVLRSFEIDGSPPTAHEFSQKRKQQRIVKNSLQFRLAEAALQLFNENPEKYSSRRALLKEVLEREGTASNVRTVVGQLGDLYPTGEDEGRPQSEVAEQLLQDMLANFRAAVQNGKTGRNGTQNGSIN